jgi:hypothetical protein
LVSWHSAAYRPATPMPTDLPRHRPTPAPTAPNPSANTLPSWRREFMAAAPRLWLFWRHLRPRLPKLPFQHTWTGYGIEYRWWAYHSNDNHAHNNQTTSPQIHHHPCQLLCLHTCKQSIMHYHSRKVQPPPPPLTPPAWAGATLFSFTRSKRTIPTHRPSPGSFATSIIRPIMFP